MEVRGLEQPATPRVVLLAGDDEDTLAMTALALEFAGFRAIPVADGAQACERAQAIHPSVVVTDLALAGIDGWEVVRRLKNDSRTHDIPVVVLTDPAEATQRERAQREGCASLSKPCQPMDLISALHYLLQGQSGRRRLG